MRCCRVSSAPRTVAVDKTQMDSRNNHCRSPATYKTSSQGERGMEESERRSVIRVQAQPQFENAGVIIAARKVLV